VMYPLVPGAPVGPLIPGMMASLLAAVGLRTGRREVARGKHLP
jgi:hypothetical protein